ncbi:unnamed protein product [Adineta ricciae]|uniref:Uncharacterized protein n=1 Tax=Adineta ricciae TaxID=249248 RepID=A0A815JJH3_ADIRI|nr:unnamed protein product [Adineta ricciae]CAF1377485.1 unnamed protein product [Adineta ricciae]
MSKSKRDLTAKFFHPPHRTVSCHNGLLDTRTKHIVARDRLAVAHQRAVESERRKSASNLQFLAFEQKQFEKKLSSRFGSDQFLPSRHRSISDASDRRRPSWHAVSETKLSESLNASNTNVLAAPKSVEYGTRFSLGSDDDPLENPISFQDEEQRDNLTVKTKKNVQTPSVAVIPPDDDV